MILCCEGCWKKHTLAVIKADINWLNSHQVTSLATRLPTVTQFLGWIPVNNQLQYLKIIATIQRHYKNRAGRDGSAVKHQFWQSTRYPITVTTQIRKTRVKNMIPRVSAYLNQQLRQRTDFILKPRWAITVLREDDHFLCTTSMNL
jgi:hypothetical protein